MENNRDISCGKTSPALSVPARVKTSAASSKRSVKSQTKSFQCLLATGGNPQVLSWEADSALLGEYWTRNTGESPNEDAESTLSQILEARVQEKYYLSPRACQGILNRSSARGKELPTVLKKALTRQASVLTGTTEA